MSDDLKISGLNALQRALRIWVRLERRPGDPEVTERISGNIPVVDVRQYLEAPPNSVRADVHFVVVAPTEGFPDREELIETVRAALGPGEFHSCDAQTLVGGPSYITLGGWLGSQDLALMLIGAVELAGISPAFIPESLGLNAETADQMAGAGFVMLGPWGGWEE